MSRINMQILSFHSRHSQPCTLCTGRAASCSRQHSVHTCSAQYCGTHLPSSAQALQHKMLHKFDSTVSYPNVSGAGIVAPQESGVLILTLPAYKGPDRLLSHRAIAATHNTQPRGRPLVNSSLSARGAAGQKIHTSHGPDMPHSALTLVQTCCKSTQLGEDATSRGCSRSPQRHLAKLC